MIKRLLALALFVLALASASLAHSAPKTEIAYASTKDIRNINPHLYAGEMAAQGMVFEPLVMNTREGIKPWLAESWDISADGREYLFHLRRNVKFSDGEPFTAHTTNPVPFCVIGYDCTLREGGVLADIAPTMLKIMNLPQPEEMTGKSIIV